MSTYPHVMQLAATLLAGALLAGALAVIPRRPLRWLLWLALVGAIGVVLWLTLALTFGDAGGTGLNLVPFQEIRRGLDSQGGRPQANVLGNVALFVPIGALVAWLARRWGAAWALMVGLALSAGIELTQFGLGRVADIDDVILNTTGAFLGGLLAVTWAGVVRRRWAGYGPRAIKRGESGYDEPAGL